MSFHNRSDAGRRLAKLLTPHKTQHPVILALPRGGVPVAAEVAEALHVPFDLLIVRKIGVPIQPELAMGAVVDSREPLIIRNEDIIRAAGVSEASFGQACETELAEIRRRREHYLGGRVHPELKGRCVIVIDDGVATGATTRAALRAVRKQDPARLILAVPVASGEVLHELHDDADEILCLEKHDPFGAVGLYYEHFAQVSDADVAKILASFPAEEPAATMLHAH